MADLVVFVPDLGGGGAERVMARLANGFAAEGRRVDLICLRAQGPTASTVSPAVHVVDLRRRLREALPALTRYLRQSRPTAFLIGYDHHCVIPIIAARLSRLPMRVVATVHINLGAYLRRDGSLGPARRALAGVVLPMADSVVAVSQGVSEDLSRWSRRMAHRLTVAPNPVLSAEIREMAEESTGHPWLDSREEPVVLGVGRLSAQKDWLILVRAFALLRAQRPARLVILGEGAERRCLEAEVDRLGLSGDVALPAWARNPYAWMARASVLAHSAINEGLPTVLIEALGLGLPVVSTDCPSGPREILDGGRWGWLVPMRDPQALADAMAQAMENSGRAIRHIAEKSAWDRYSLTSSLAAYRDLLFA